MKKLTKENFMKLFIIFAIPVIYSMIYDFLMRITTYKSWVGIGLSLIFLIIWYFAGRYIGKQKIDYKTAVYGIHGLLIIGSVLSLIAVLMYSQAPTFLEMIMVYTNLYTLALEAITTPLIIMLTYFFEVEDYFIYLNLACIISCITMMGIFTAGYERTIDD